MKTHRKLGLGVTLAGAFAAATITSTSNSAPRGRPIGLAAFRVIPSESGDVNYYQRVEGPVPHIHAEYKPPWKTAVLGYELPEKERRGISAIEWQWRAVALPNGGTDCIDGKGDSAATIYVTWKRGLKWYSIKYAWSGAGPEGKICRRKRNPFRAMDTVVVESGPPLGEWRKVRIEPDKEFRNHFEDGDQKAEVPDLVGIGILTDGDQTGSVSAADYAGFVIVPK